MSGLAGGAVAQAAPAVGDASSGASAVGDAQTAAAAGDDWLHPEDNKILSFGSCRGSRGPALGRLAGAPPRPGR
ncbi:hypothetical protein [Streptomyces sp. NPDC006274]|uniref:hypothetical protein n=1 Tax=unclassified Streptomyces TaxID=2593676 RepID=UPI0033A915E1